MKFLVDNKRWILGALIILAIGILVWFVGPVLSFGENYPLESALRRGLLVFVLVAGWLGFEAYRLWRIRRRSRELLEGLAQGNQDATQSQEEARILRERFTAAMTSLKDTKFGKASGSTALYQLPWYMIIGAPGSGKTTSLLNSGLRFPLVKPGDGAAALSGIGGTRNCDWWFTDHAVLIDTAGRYTTQDSNAVVDHSAWKTFLGLLRRFRPRQPINGILVTLSVGDLLSFEPAERQRYAQTVRLRVDELQHELGLDFPIYVLVTKVDLVSGFNEFFSTFDAEQRAQVWGITFNFDLQTRVAEGAKAGFERGFPALTSRLNELLFQRLQDERDAERRAVMYPFPQQFAALGPLITEFMEGAFGESKLQGNAVVRGLYFTSGTQQGAPIDRLVSSLTKSLNLSGGKARASSNVGASKAFFITNLLKEVVFAEAGLAGFSEKRNAAMRRLSWGLLIGALLLSVGFAAWATVSYLRNGEALKNTVPWAEGARQRLVGIGGPSTEDLPQLVDALSALQELPTAFHDPVDEPTMAMRAGLYQGTALQERVSERYRYALQQGLLPRVAVQLEQVMQAPQSRPEHVYTALKAYVMLYDTSRKIDSRWFVGAMTDSWGQAVPEAVRTAARPHLAELAELADMKVATLHAYDATAVATARARVAKLSVVDRAYSQLLAESTEGVPVFRLSEVVGPAGADLLVRSGKSLAEPVPGIFTKQGYQQVVRERLPDVVKGIADEEKWVMGELSSGQGQRSQPELAQAVQARYLAEFMSTWDGVLAEVSLRRLGGVKDALLTAQVLSRPDSPLRKLVQAVNHQTRLTSVDKEPGDDAKDKAKEELKTKLKQAASSRVPLPGAMDSAIGSALAGSANTRAIEMELDQHFADLRRLAADGKSADMDAAAQLMLELANALTALQSKAANGTGLREVLPRFEGAKTQGSGMPKPLSGAILALAEYGEKEASGGAQKEMKVGVGGAAAVCARSIPGNYPFVKSSAQDLGVQDFVTVFKAGGELDTFFTTNLATFVDKSGASWRLKGETTGQSLVSAATLRQFQNAEAIRIAFLGGTATPAVTADIAVVAGDGEVGLEYDGTSHKLRVGSRGARLQWPAMPGARLTLGGQPLVAVEGPWSLFRLIDKGTLEPGASGDKLRVAYSAAGGSKVVLEVRAASSAYNPFRLRELGAFACPRE